MFSPGLKHVNDWRTIAMEDRPACISIADVQHAVARASCLSISEMLSRKRRHRLTGARQVAMYLSREMAGGGWMGRRRQAASLPRIGMAFERDHSSLSTPAT
jgi:chromosomal replication initiation ATPase DnaA